MVSPGLLRPPFDFGLAHGQAVSDLNSLLSTSLTDTLKPVTGLAAIAMMDFVVHHLPHIGIRMRAIKTDSATITIAVKITAAQNPIDFTPTPPAAQSLGLF